MQDSAPVCGGERVEDIVQRPIDEAAVIHAARGLVSFFSRSSARPNRVSRRGEEASGMRRAVLASILGLGVWFAAMMVAPSPVGATWSDLVPQDAELAQESDPEEPTLTSTGGHGQLGDGSEPVGSSADVFHAAALILEIYAEVLGL